MTGVKWTVALLGLAFVLAGCSASARPLPAVTSTTTTTLAPSAPATAAINPGPTTSAAGTCPYIAAPAVADALGIRLGTQSVQTAGAAAVGCQFFATTDPAFVASEHLPGPNQPVLQISSSRYPSTTAAHNAMVAIGTSSANAPGSVHSATVAGGIVGVAYQTTFDPSAGNQDWAFVFSTGSTVVTVLTVQTDSELDAQMVAGQIAPRF